MWVFAACVAWSVLVPLLLADRVVVTQDLERDLFRSLSGDSVGPPLGPFGFHLGPLWNWILKGLPNPHLHVVFLSICGGAAGMVLYAATRNELAVVLLLASESLVQSALLINHTGLAPLLECLMVLGAVLVVKGRPHGAYLAAAALAVEAQLFAHSWPGLLAALVFLAWERKRLARHVAGALAVFVVCLLPLLLTQQGIEIGSPPAHEAGTYNRIGSVFTLLFAGLGVAVDGVIPVAWTLAVFLCVGFGLRSQRLTLSVRVLLALDIGLTALAVAITATIQLKLTYVSALVVPVAALAGVGALDLLPRLKAPRVATVVGLLVLVPAVFWPEPGVVRRLPQTPPNLSEQQQVVDTLAAWGVDRASAPDRVHGSFRGYLTLVWWLYDRADVQTTGALPPSAHVYIVPPDVARRLGEQGELRRAVLDSGRLVMVARTPDVRAELVDCDVVLPFGYHPLCSGQVPGSCEYLRVRCGTDRDRATLDVQATRPFVVQATPGCPVTSSARVQQLPTGDDHSRSRWLVQPHAPTTTVSVGPCGRILTLDVW